MEVQDSVESCNWITGLRGVNAITVDWQQLCTGSVDWKENECAFPQAQGKLHDANALLAVVQVQEVEQRFMMQMQRFRKMQLQCCWQFRVFIQINNKIVSQFFTITNLHHFTSAIACSVVLLVLRIGHSKFTPTFVE